MIIVIYTGYTYYPSRYYAIAIPAYIVMVFLISGTYYTDDDNDDDD